MKPSPLVLLAFGLLQGTTAATPASAQTDSAAHPTPEVRTSATVERRVRPDFASFTLTFDATGPTPLAAGRTVAARAEHLRNALAALGIPRDSMDTGNLRWRGRVEKTVLPPRYVSAGTDARGRETSASSMREGTEIVEPSVSVSVTVSGRWELVTRP